MAGMHVGNRSLDQGDDFEVVAPVPNDTQVSSQHSHTVSSSIVSFHCIHKFRSVIYSPGRL